MFDPVLIHVGVRGSHSQVPTPEAGHVGLDVGGYLPNDVKRGDAASRARYTHNNWASLAGASVGSPPSPVTSHLWAERIGNALYWSKSLRLRKYTFRTLAVLLGACLFSTTPAFTKLFSLVLTVPTVPSFPYQPRRYGFVFADRDELE